MTALWIAFAVVFPYLCAAYAMQKILVLRGPAAFTNPGGLKLPLGEVAMLAAVLLALAFVALIDWALNGLEVVPVIFNPGVIA